MSNIALVPEDPAIARKLMRVVSYIDELLEIAADGYETGDWVWRKGAAVMCVSERRNSNTFDRGLQCEIVGFAGMVPPSWWRKSFDMFIGGSRVILSSRAHTIHVDRDLNVFNEHLTPLLRHFGQCVNSLPHCPVEGPSKYRDEPISLRIDRLRRLWENSSVTQYSSKLTWYYFTKSRVETAVVMGLGYRGVSNTVILRNLVHAEVFSELWLADDEIGYKKMRIELGYE